MDQKQSQTYVPMKESKEKSISITNVENYNETPFTLVTTDEPTENNTFVGLAGKRLTHSMTREECERLIDEKDYSLLVSLMIHIAENKDLITQIMGGK